MTAERSPVATPPALFVNDAWLSDVMCRSVYRWTGAGEVDAAAVAREMASLANGGDAFFFAKTTPTDADRCRMLGAAGFAIVDTGITFAWSGDTALTPPPAVIVGPARPSQHSAVADVAERSFRWSRFHLDTRIEPALANHVKRRWIENYCVGARGAGLYVAEVAGVVAGFLAVIESRVNGEPAATIDLIAVAPEFQGRRVGAALVALFIAEWRSRVAHLRVATQAANIRSMRFYEGLGFRAAESGYVFHAHYRDGALWV